MSDKHLSSQFESDLNDITGQLMAFGGVVEKQLRHAMRALSELNVEAADEALASGSTINAMELTIDRDLTSIIARRQPAARDLRLLITISKSTANLERLGDESEKIARMVKSLIAEGGTRDLPKDDLRVAAELATRSLRMALDCLSRLDTQGALVILREDAKIDQEFARFVTKMVAYMMADPKHVALGLDLVFIAKAIERIGDHTKNIAECTIYLAAGEDVRHLPLEKIETAVQASAQPGAT